MAVLSCNTRWCLCWWQRGGFFVFLVQTNWSVHPGTPTQCCVSPTLLLELHWAPLCAFLCCRCLSACVGPNESQKQHITQLSLHPKEGLLCSRMSLAEVGRIFLTVVHNSLLRSRKHPLLQKHWQDVQLKSRWVKSRGVRVFGTPLTSVTGYYTILWLL